LQNIAYIKMKELALLQMIILVVFLPGGCTYERTGGRLLERQIPDLEYSSDPIPSVDSNEPTDAITLRQAVSLALIRNPELAAFSLEIRAAEARELQESLPPNPEAGMTVENVAGSGDYRGTDLTETTIGISQLLETGRKREKRTRVAEIQTKLASWDYEKKRLEVLTDVALRFIDMLAAQRRLELARQNADLAAKLLETVDKQIKAGMISPIEHDKQSVETVTTRLKFQRAQRHLAAARHQLAAAWASNNPQFKAAAGDLASIKPIPPIQALANLVSQNPDIARWTTEMTQRQAALDLARAQGHADVTAGMGIRRLNESDDTALVFELSLPLTIFNRNQGNVQAAQHDKLKAIQAQHAAEVRVRAALTAAYEELAASYAEAVALRDEGLPAAQRAFDGAQEAFRRGQFNYLSLLDAQRTLIETRSQYIDALVSYHSAVIEVEGLVGHSIESLDISPQTQAQKGHISNGPSKKK
jgi:cobalt-zinc-cadmium efflux system outer membrane protein